MKAKKHPYITRIERDDCRPHWWVRFQREVQGKRVALLQHRFHDDEWGGKTAALTAAIAYRDDRLKRVPQRQNAPVPPGHGYVRKTSFAGRLAWEGWVRLEEMRCSRTKNFIDVWGPRAAKRRCEEWLARHRKAIAERAAAALRPRAKRAA